MSTAGIRSNRGDGYQTLVAMDWALTVLSDSEFQWIEVDSVISQVDDIVVGKSDGTLICCQCKKNQKDFKAWTIAGLRKELDKAAKLLDSNKKAEARFYSRSPFGALAKLREHSTTQPDEARYSASLGKELQEIDAELATQLTHSSLHLSTYDFLCRTSFENCPELDRMKDLLLERLRRIVSNPDAAYDALWRRLDQLGARMDGSTSASAQHRLSKEDLEAVLHQSGAVLSPIMDLAEVRDSFADISTIGRSWQRKIAGHSIHSPVLNDLLSAIEAKKHSVLLSGLPGSGKTCVMLSLQEELERCAQIRTDMIPLFIQAREFVDFTTAHDREVQGLPGQWVEKVARTSEEAQVVVVIDSLDVLSTAREHSVLTYFLAQVDRLLQIPNVTVITACREFDRQYDRRIAERQWDCELLCSPLDWESEIVPLLEELGIDTKSVPDNTRELIKNPRELALFVELVQRDENLNIVSSQALAQRYLEIFVQDEVALGNTAMQTIEDMAAEMLRSRRLAVPYQRVSVHQDVLRLLCSLNVLRETQRGELTFGHQTLLDVLVISGAIRRGSTLNEFIHDLPPVPFVRPSIRSFVAQLAMGDRREFRKQVRAVLTSDAAFHIRRLVAESFAEQVPQEGDWPLLRDLQNRHKEVFQVIYTQARQVEWHYLWLDHLVPVLKDTRDVDGLIAHAHRVSQWNNDDAKGVLAFWTELFHSNWIEKELIVRQIEISLSKIDTEYLELATPLLEQLLSMPRQEHSFLGHSVARCVTAGVMDDVRLWHYIAGDIDDDDVIEYNFNNKLHCQSYEFGGRDDNFLLHRMTQSTKLLDLALSSVEKWSRIVSSHYRTPHINHISFFLSRTSYKDSHTQHDISHKNSCDILFEAMEAAILNHAEIYSDWWQENRDRLCFSHEGALRYFAIQAFTLNPEANIDLIGRILKDEGMLESDLSYELGILIKTAFIYLPKTVQGEVVKRILTLREDRLTDTNNLDWILRKRVELISIIPCHLRSPDAQAMLDNYERIYGVLIFQPMITSGSGWISAPFPSEVFHRLSDNNVLRLLVHYSGYKGDVTDFWIDGVEQVGRQLCEAASRHPTRFLRLLPIFWSDISDRFHDEIMDGIANYLEYRFGKLQTKDKWEPLEEPDAPVLASNILDELERHPKHWYQNRTASNVMQACAYVINDTQNAARLVSLAMGFETLQEKGTNEGDSIDLMATGINMIKGHVVEALMILANRFQEQDVSYPELLLPALRRFTGNEHPAVRALILDRLPYLQYHNPELGWDLFDIAMQDATGLWQVAEPCLYNAYYKHYEKVEPLLERLYRQGSGKDMETWGRISALAALAEHIDFPVLLDNLKTMDNTEAWSGAASVWVHPENAKHNREQCLTGIEAGLKAKEIHAAAVAQRMDHLFSENNLLSIPIELIHLYFAVCENDDENKYDHFFGFEKWLNATSHHDPEQALAVAAIYLSYIKRAKSYLYDYENNLTQLMTRLFAEAEEREESDGGEMLKHVVSMQDMLLSLGVSGVNEWLKAAERP